MRKKIRIKILKMANESRFSYDLTNTIYTFYVKEEYIKLGFSLIGYEKLNDGDHSYNFGIIKNFNNQVIVTSAYIMKYEFI